MPGVDDKVFFPFFIIFVFFFLLRSHLAKGSVCLSVSCVEKIVWSLKTFVSIDCFRTQNIGWVCEGKTTKTFPESNSIIIVIPSQFHLYLSKIINLTRYK